MDYKIHDGLRNRYDRNTEKQRTLYQGGFITVYPY